MLISHFGSDLKWKSSISILQADCFVPCNRILPSIGTRMTETTAGRRGGRNNKRHFNRKHGNGQKRARIEAKQRREEAAAAAVAAKTCVVCSSTEAKYKCPVCFIRFCSVGCSRKHKADGCVAPPAPKEAPAPVPTRQLTRLELDSQVDVVLSASQKAALDVDEGVQRQVGDSRLRAVMKTILEADDRRAALDAAMMHDAYFMEFCDAVLQAAGFFDTEQADGV